MNLHLTRKFAALFCLAAGLGLLGAACGDDDVGGAVSEGPGGAVSPGTAGQSDLEGSITVFAAASLTDAFGEIADGFEAANPGVSVESNFGASSALREQILAGAPADVFASANLSNMDQVVEADAAAGDPQTFATNRLEIAVPADNPGHVTGMADFGDDDLLIGLCAAEVPCGEFGREALANAGVTPAVDTEEPDVRSLLTKVESGDLDAGLVYVTDVLAAGDAVEGIEIPADHNVVAEYPIATLAEAGDATLADAFIAYVVSDEGEDILASYGFDEA
jgi:molybdate transport system substrate-binding protein